MLLFFFLPLLLIKAHPQTTTIVQEVSDPELVSDVLGRISELADEETSLNLSMVNKFFQTKTHERNTATKLEQLKLSCPNEYYKLTLNGYSDGRCQYGFYGCPPDKDGLLDLIERKTRCINAMTINMPSINNVLKSLTIWIPPSISESPNEGRLDHSDIDAEITESVARYFKAIQRLFSSKHHVESIEIVSVADMKNQLDANVESMLYELLLSLNIPSVKFNVFLNDHQRFNLLCEEIKITSMKFMSSMNSTLFKLPLAIHTLSLPEKSNHLELWHLTSLRSIATTSDVLLRVPFKNNQIKVLSITDSIKTVEPLRRICHLVDHLEELSLSTLDISHYQFQVLEEWILKHKPTLQSLSFVISQRDVLHWTSFLVKLLKENQVIKRLAFTLYPATPEYNQAFDLSFLNSETGYSLTHLSILGSILDQQVDITIITRFVEDQKSLKHVSLGSLEDLILADAMVVYLTHLFEAIDRNPSVTELNIRARILFGTKASLMAFFQTFGDLLRVFGDREFTVNGIPCKKVIETLRDPIDGQYVFHHFMSSRTGVEYRVLLLNF